MPASVGIGGHNQFPHTPAGCQHRIAFLPAQQGQSRRLGHFKDGRRPLYGIAGLDGPPHRVVYPGLPANELHGIGQDIQAAFPAIGQGDGHNLRAGETRPCGIGHDGRHLRGGHALLERIRCNDDFHIVEWAGFSP